MELAQKSEIAEILKAGLTCSEESLLSIPQVDCPVLHHFSPGICMREVSIPAGTFAIGHIQKKEHLNILLKGSVAMVDGDKVNIIRAPMQFIGKPGRKVGYVLEDMVWLNIYATDLKSVEEVENEFIDKSEEFKSREKDLLTIESFFKQEDREDFLKLIEEAGFDEKTVREQSENLTDQIDFPDGICNVVIKNSPIEGRGVFLTSHVKSGEFVAMVRISDKRTPVGRYTNHSKHPNATFVKMNNGDVALVALRDIDGCKGGQSGEEVTIDYRVALAIRFEEVKPCLQ